MVVLRVVDRYIPVLVLAALAWAVWDLARLEGAPPVVELPLRPFVLLAVAAALGVEYNALALSTTLGVEYNASALSTTLGVEYNASALSTTLGAEYSEDGRQKPEDRMTAALSTTGMREPQRIQRAQRGEREGGAAAFFVTRLARGRAAARGNVRWVFFVGVAGLALAGIGLAGVNGNALSTLGGAWLALRGPLGWLALTVLAAWLAGGTGAGGDTSEEVPAAEESILEKH